MMRAATNDNAHFGSALRRGGALVVGFDHLNVAVVERLKVAASIGVKQVEQSRLVRALAALYGLSQERRRMRARETFTAIALHQGEIDVEAQPVKLKLFGRDAESLPGEYNESFLNIDLVNGLIFWNEKDQEYRMPLVHSLSDAV